MARPDHIFYISGPADITEENFRIIYGQAIKKSNAEYPDCDYLLTSPTGDTSTSYRAYHYLRKIGVSPNRVIIFCVKGGSTIHNPFKCPVREFSIESERQRCIIHYSTQDITWKDDDTGRTVITRRREKYLSIGCAGRGMRPKHSSIYIPN